MKICVFVIKTFTVKEYIHNKFEIRRDNSSAVKKPRFRRFGISTGSKAQQANLRSLAKDMAQDPGMLIPGCAGKCSRCQFDKVLAKLRKIQSFRDNPDALKKLASSGKQLERGYAVMLILAQETAPIMFATAKLPTGDVGYTIRGKVKKEVLIGLQHFDDPRLRLLAYSEIALKKKLHIYSLDEDILCSGSGPNYPADLVSEIMARSGYSLKKSQSGYRCEHSSGSGLEVNIISAGTAIRICRACASRKSNLFTELTSRVLAKRPEEDFDIHLEHDITCKLGDGCSLSGKVPGSRELIARYRSGELSDLALIDEYRTAVTASASKSGKAIFVLGDACFESDFEGFIKALAPSELESAALRRMLKNATEPVILDDATPNSVLTLFWDTQGANAIHAVIGDKDLARQIYLENRKSGKLPAQILRDAKVQVQSKTALAGLPEFTKLSKLGSYADDMARTYKALGREEALRKLTTVQGETKMKSLICGFLNALDSMKGKEWQFTKEEQDYGRYLGDFAKALLDSKSETYKDALKNLLDAAGADDDLK